jgi:anthranilate phosphoribosyltransferase
MLKNSIEKLMHREDLCEAEIHEAIANLLTEEVNPHQAAVFLALLHAKPETAEEILALVKAMREMMHPIKAPNTLKILDLVGTGGDKANTVNISTAASILAASCGVKIIKHGNRSVSSLCGSADILETMGVNIHLPAEEILHSVDKLGIAFCFAPNFHPALAKLRQIRKSLGIRTTFNLIGPLLNPANPAHLLMGVSEDKLVDKLADVLFQLGTERSLVFHGSGLDEITCLGQTRAIEVTQHRKKPITINPQDYGFNLCHLSDLQGDDANYNIKLLQQVFDGHENPIADTLVLNAAVALWVYGNYPSISEGIPVARANLQNGRAKELLQQWIQF